MQYRRAKTPGATYFFTVVTFRRRKILCEPDNLELLRTAFKNMKTRHPFTIDAMVLLPEHLHCIWTLPPGDKDYSIRWNGIKGYFTRHCSNTHKTARSASQQRKQAQTVWQPRFWEHQIRDERDYEKHCDYIHWNPVKHGWVARVHDWPHSSFHRFVRLGIYSSDWAGIPDNSADDEYGRITQPECRATIEPLPDLPGCLYLFIPVVHEMNQATPPSGGRVLRATRPKPATRCYTQVCRGGGNAVIPAWTPESRAMDGNLPIAQVLDSSSVQAHGLPSVDAGFRHPCRNDGLRHKCV